MSGVVVPMLMFERVIKTGESADMDHGDYCLTVHCHVYGESNELRHLVYDIHGGND